MDEKKIHYAPCRDCGKPTPTIFDPVEFHLDGVYCSEACRVAFRAKLQNFMKTLSEKSD